MALEGKYEQRCLAWTTSCCGLLLEVVLLSCVWGLWASDDNADARLRDYDRPLGWLAVASAATIFGFCEAPIKVPESQVLGPLLFNAYSFLGNGIVHCAFALVVVLHGKSFEMKWQGVMGACNIMVVQALARSAIWLLGIAVAPPLWCVLGMATSFCWGTLVFGDRPGNFNLSLAGLAFLMAGVVLVSRASALSIVVEDTRSADTQTSHDNDGELKAIVGKPCESHTASSVIETDVLDGMEACESHRKSKDIGVFPRGLIYAVGAGVADGSMVSFYQQLEARIGPSQRSPDPTSTMFCYLGTFGITLVGVSLLLLLVIHAKGWTKDNFEIENRSFHFAAVLPGLISGAMWAGANSCSVLASRYLGMAVSFPLTQTAVIFCGLLGIFVFDELRGCRARSIFCVALVVIGFGAATLAIYGQPTST